MRRIFTIEDRRLPSQPGPVEVADKPRKLDEKSLVTLDPGQSIADNITLESFKELPKPGTYQITGVLYSGYFSMFEPSTRKKIQTGEIKVWHGPKAKSLPVLLRVD